MNATNTTVLLTLLGGSVLWLAYESMRMVARKRRRFQARQQLTYEQLCREFRCDSLSPHEIHVLLRILADATDLPAPQLRRHDRFLNELAPEKGWEYDDGLNLLPLALVKEFGGTFADYDLERNADIDALLNAIDRVRSTGLGR